MNHSLSYRDHIAFKYASRSKRIQALRNAVLVTGLVMAYGIVGTIDYAEEQRQEAEANAKSASAMSATLAACLNGTARFTHAGPHTDGHGTTGIACRKAEEYKL